jgi:tripartite-type tricarboxylate transporter receptor subunit TctC
MKSNQFGKYCVLLTIVAVFLLGANPAEPAEDVASFYRGQVVRLVVGTTPGGAYDNYARLLSPVLQKRLSCTVAVINKAGAGGLVAMNDLYEAPRKDGLTLGLAMEGIPLAQAIGVDGVRFDCRKFGWLATIYKDVRFIYVAPASPYKSIDDLKKLKPAKAATTTVTSPSGPTLVLAIEALGIDNAKIIAGYPGSTEVILAVRRGEADFTCQSINHALKKDALVRPLVVVEEKRAPEFPNVPAFTEFGIKPEAKRVMELIMMGQASGRALVAPPGVPDEKIKFLRNVISSSLKDPEFVKKAQTLGLELDPVTGDKTAANVQKALDMTPDEAKKLKYIITQKYL